MDYWCNGKKVELKAIYNKGEASQIVVLTVAGANYLGSDSVLLNYPENSVFLIIAKYKEEDLEYYDLRDSSGNVIKLNCTPHYGDHVCRFLSEMNHWMGTTVGARIKSPATRF